jgi:hypothetical protein
MGLFLGEAFNQKANLNIKPSNKNTIKVEELPML